MFLDVALDLVLDEVGDDRVEDRAEDEVLHAGCAGGVDDGEAHLLLLGIEGWSDVVDFFHAVHGLRQQAGVGDVAGDDVGDACPAERVRGSVGADAGAEAMPGREKLGDQQLALVAIRGRNEDHDLALCFLETDGGASGETSASRCSASSTTCCGVRLRLF